MRPPRILLIGMGGLENYGCEAIARGTDAIIRSALPEAEVVYATPRQCIAYDTARASGCALRVVERAEPARYSPRNLLRVALDRLHVPWQPGVYSPRLLRGIDAVFSVGGDLYTLRPNGGYNRILVQFGEHAMDRRIPWVLWGASVGPFTSNPAAERILVGHLRRMTAITAREVETVDYLRSVGVTENVVPCADPAYVVAPHVQQPRHFRNGELLIGLNLSPLSVQFANVPQGAVMAAQAAAIEALVTRLPARVLLVPHTFCYYDRTDDDGGYLREVRGLLKPEIARSTVLLDRDLGFEGAKQELVKCDLVLAARMHCAINAMAALVPTILLSYSRKAVGMCQTIYGTRDWVLPVEEFDPAHAVTHVRRLLDRNDEVRARLASRIPEMRALALSPMRGLARKLGFLQRHPDDPCTQET